MRRGCARYVKITIFGDKPRVPKGCFHKRPNLNVMLRKLTALQISKLFDLKLPETIVEKLGLVQQLINMSKHIDCDSKIWEASNEKNVFNIVFLGIDKP